jgi:hypothetical protein
LRDYIIENFVKNSSEDVLIKEIKKMLSIYNNKNKKIIIDVEFPKNRLIKIMKPYLILYLQSQYSFVPIIKNNTSILLYNKLKMFRNFNPKFGRKIYKLGFKYDSNFKRKSYIKSIEFLDNHIAFNYSEELKFLKNHTYYNEVNTNEELTYIFAVYNNNNNNMNIVEEEDEDDDEYEHENNIIHEEVYHEEVYHEEAYHEEDMNVDTDYDEEESIS